MDCLSFGCHKRLSKLLPPSHVLSYSLDTLVDKDFDDEPVGLNKKFDQTQPKEIER